MPDKRLIALRSDAFVRRRRATLRAIIAQAYTMQHCVMIIDIDIKHGRQLSDICSFPVSYTTKEVR